MPYRRYIVRFALLSAVGMIAIVVANWSIDPFLYNRSGVVDFSHREVTYQISPDIYKAARLHNASWGTYFFGDSTMDQLDPELLGLTQAVELVNLAVPGQTLPDTIDAMRLTASSKLIERIYLGIPFRHYDDNQTRRVFLSDAKVAGNFFTFNTSAISLKATLYSLVYLATGANLSKSQLPVPPDEFWDYQAAAVRSLLGARSSAENLRAALLQSVCELRASGVDVTIIVPPVFQELRDMISAEFGDDYTDYKAWLPELGVVLDYDIVSALTRDRANFEDHFHLKRAAAANVLADIMSESPNHARVFRQAPRCRSGS